MALICARISAGNEVRSGFTTPSLKVDAENHECLWIRNASRDRPFERLELVVGHKAVGDQAVTQVFGEVDEERTASVSRRIDVHDRIDLYVNESSLTQKTRELAADVEVDTVRPVT